MNKVLIILMAVSMNIIHPEFSKAEVQRNTHIFAAIQTKFHCPRIKKYKNEIVAIRIFRSAKDTFFVYDEEKSGFKFPRSGQSVTKISRPGYVANINYNKYGGLHNVRINYNTREGIYYYHYGIKVNPSGTACQIKTCAFGNNHRLYKKYCEMGCRVEYCEIRRGSPS